MFDTKIKYIYLGHVGRGANLRMKRYFNGACMPEMHSAIHVLFLKYVNVLMEVFPMKKAFSKV